MPRVAKYPRRRRFKRKALTGMVTRYMNRKKRRVGTLYAKRNFALYRNPFNKPRALTVLRYNQIISLDPTTGSIGGGGSNTWIFSMNSLFDPDTTGTGHQPMYYDNYNALYNRYRVNYAQITATIINHSVNTATGTGAGNTLTTTPNYSYRFAIVADRDNPNVSENPPNISQLIEEGGSNIRWRHVAPSLNGKLPKLFHSGSPHRLSGLAFKDDTLQADIGSSPSRQTYFWMTVASADGFTDPPSVYVSVQIKYYCEFFDRRTNQAEQ